MHASRSILVDRVVHRGVEDAKVVPDGNISLINWRHQDELWFQYPVLNVSEKVADLD